MQNDLFSNPHHLSNEEFKELSNKIGEIAKTYQSDPTLLTDLAAFKAQFYQFSVRNTMMIHLQNPAATFVASFTKWKSMGYSIKKGARHMKILRPIEKETFPRQTDGKTEWVDVKKTTNEEKAKIAAGQLKTIDATFFVPYQVFDISQTTCPPEDYPKIYSMGYADIAHQELYECVKEYAKSSGFEVLEKDLNSISLLGYYDKETNQIVINSLLQDTRRLETICHELAHGVLHRTSTQPVPVKEFEAECFAAMLKRKMGFPVSEASKNYIQSSYKNCPSDTFDMDKTFQRLSKAFLHVSSGIDQTVIDRGYDLNPQREKNMSQAKNRAVSPADVSQNFIRDM